MPDYHNPYIRLQSYYCWLSNDRTETQVDDTYDFGVPIQRLHTITGIPLKILRRDILCLFQWQNRLEFDEESLEYRVADQIYHLGHLYKLVLDGNFPTDLEQLFLNGKLDTIPLHLVNNTMSYYQISLTSEEAEALYAYRTDGTKWNNSLMVPAENFQNKIYQSRYRIKDSYRFNHCYIDLNTNLDKINQAIQNDKWLKMRYRKSNNKIISFHFKPLKIAYDSTDNLYAVLSIYKGRIQVHRLDRIIQLEPDNNIHHEQSAANLLSIYPNVWGFSFSKDPEHVKVRFYNEANVWQKVRKDLACRTNGKIYEQDGFLYYEDTVYGINKFRNWIYGYGSSAIVLEPEKLRKEIIESLKARQGLY